MFVGTHEVRDHLASFFFFYQVERRIHGQESNCQPLHLVSGTSPLSSGSVGSSHTNPRCCSWESNVWFPPSTLPVLSGVKFPGYGLNKPQTFVVANLYSTELLVYVCLGNLCANIELDIMPQLEPKNHIYFNQSEHDTWHWHSTKKLYGVCIYVCFFVYSETKKVT